MLFSFEPIAFSVGLKFSIHVVNATNAEAYANRADEEPKNYEADNSKNCIHVY